MDGGDYLLCLPAVTLTGLGNPTLFCNVQVTDLYEKQWKDYLAGMFTAIFHVTLDYVTLYFLIIFCSSFPFLRTMKTSSKQRRTTLCFHSLGSVPSPQWKWVNVHTERERYTAASASLVSASRLGIIWFMIQLVCHAHHGLMCWEMEKSVTPLIQLPRLLTSVC